MAPLRTLCFPNWHIITVFIISRIILKFFAANRFSLFFVHIRPPQKLYYRTAAAAANCTPRLGILVIVNWRRDGWRWAGHSIMTFRWSWHFRIIRACFQYFRRFGSAMKLKNSFLKILVYVITIIKYLWGFPYFAIATGSSWFVTTVCSKERILINEDNYYVCVCLHKISTVYAYFNHRIFFFNVKVTKCKVCIINQSTHHIGCFQWMELEQ